MNGYDAWKTTEPDQSPDGNGCRLTGAARLAADIELTLRYMVYEEPGLAAWWARQAVRTARGLGLYPTTAQLEAETRRAA